MSLVAGSRSGRGLDDRDDWSGVVSCGGSVGPGNGVSSHFELVGCWSWQPTWPGEDAESIGGEKLGPSKLRVWLWLAGRDVSKTFSSPLSFEIV